jgi:serine/threonine protein kinase
MDAADTTGQDRFSAIEETGPLPVARTCLRCGLEANAKDSICPNDGTEITRTIKLTGLDRYEFIHLIGQSPLSSVYKAKHFLTHKYVAIKLLRPKDLTSAGMGRFLTEAANSRMLRHENIAEVTDFGKTDGSQPYMVMDYIDGASLASLISKEGRLPLRTAMDLMLQAARGLMHAHKKGVFHRDIKPSNLMLSEREDGFNLHIIDFAVARLSDEESAKMMQLGKISEPGNLAPGKFIGSPGYMAPEQCLGRAFTERSDIYALGCVFYEMITGRPPHVGINDVEVIFKTLNDHPPTLKQLIAEPTPAGLQEILTKCLAKEPSERYNTMEDLYADLVHFEEMLRESLSSGVYRKLRLKTTNRKRWTIVAGLGLIGIACGVSVLWHIAGVPSTSDASGATARHSGFGRIPTNQIDDMHLVRFAHDPKNADLDALILDSSAVTDNGVSHIPQLKNLRKLSLGKTAITDEALQSILQLKKLESLTLRQTRVSDRGMRLLTDLPLKELRLTDTAIGNAGVQLISKIKTLSILGLERTYVTDKGIAYLQNLPHLTTLDLASTKVSEDGLKSIGTLSSLRTLDLKGMAISYQSMESVSKLRLEMLDLTGCSFAPFGLKPLANAKSLEEINLERTNVTGAMLSPLASLPKLRALSLRETGITDSDMRYVWALTQLERLNLADTAVSYQNGLKLLTGKRSLKWLNLKGCKNLTESQIQQLQAKLPGCEIIH